MKIVCEACGAKYSIADDRVAGKVFKIRCKRCSEVIVVRGDQPEAAAPAQAAAGAAYDDQSAIWHVVVEGEQAGPYTPAQLGEMLTAGTVDWEAYVWTEGFDNWVPMRDVADLVAQITGQDAAQPAASAGAEPAYRAASSATLTGQPSMGADPFADDRDGGGFGGGGQASVAGPDLFAASQDMSSPFSAAASSRQDAVVASAPSPRLSQERVMTGARNENSVLFSLKNLQALATGTPSGPPAGASSSMGGGGGFAGGEGSGLIDIRALATTTGVGGEAGGGARDELLSMGAQGGAFGALGSPMIGSAAADDGGNKKTFVWAAVAMVGMLAAAGVGIAYIVIRPAEPPAPSVGLTPAPAAVAAPAVPAAAPTAAAPTEGELAAAANTRKDEAEGSSGSSRGEHRRRDDKDRDKDKPSATGASDPLAAAVEAPSKPSKPSGPRTIDDLLDNALSGKEKAKAEAAAPASDLPKSPSREQVMSALNAVKGDVAACGKGTPGVATVAVSVAGATGRVTNAQVNGVTGPAGSCVAQAVRKAQFPKFQSGVFKVTFPFKLN